MDIQHLRRVDRQTWIALVCLAVGWFFLATLVTTVGSLQQKYHFFDMLTVMLNPAWLLYGLGSSRPLESVAFGLLDLVVLVLPLVPFVVRKRSAWLLSTAPLILMLLSGYALYKRTAGPFFASTGRGGRLTHALVDFGNALAQGMGDAVARHITVGLGGYLALLAALFLAVQGLRAFRAAVPALAPSLPPSL